MGVVNTLARTQPHKTIQVHFLPYITLLSNSTSQKVRRTKGTQDSQRRLIWSVYVDGWMVGRGVNRFIWARVAEVEVVLRVKVAAGFLRERYCYTGTLRTESDSQISEVAPAAPLARWAASSTCQMCPDTRWTGRPYCGHSCRLCPPWSVNSFPDGARGSGCQTRAPSRGRALRKVSATETSFWTICWLSRGGCRWKDLASGSFFEMTKSSFAPSHQGPFCYFLRCWQNLSVFVLRMRKTMQIKRRWWKRRSGGGDGDDGGGGWTDLCASHDFSRLLRTHFAFLEPESAL